MAMGINIVLKVLINTGALWAAVRYISGFHIAPTELVRLDFLPVAIPTIIQTYVAGGIALAIINAVLHPILKAIGAALPLITGAMLMVVFNIALLYFAAEYIPQITIGGWKPLIFSGLLVGIVNSIL